MMAPATPIAFEPQAKEDPEALALRGRPRPAVRFRRGLIVAATGSVASAVVALAWLALDPPALHNIAAAPDSAEPAARAADQALEGLPATYGDAPRLGPPLPGDLGRPILEQQRSLVAAEPAPDSPAMLRAEQARVMTAERERAAAVRQAARASGVLVQLADGSRSASAAAPGAANAPQDATKAPVTAGAANALRDGGPTALRAAPSPWTLSAGTVIPASLMTGLDSDLPGMVIAQVTQDVRDSATGRTVLIPQGARLIGRYDSKIAYGQRRAFLSWSRIVLPGGTSVDLDEMPATDAAGRSGLADRVDRHGWQLVKGAALSTLLGIGAELSLGGGGALARALRGSAQQNGMRAGDQLVARNLDVQPTITVRPGWPVRVLVDRDLVLEPWRG